MRFRKLRIAWSVVMGIACVLLIVLWVRSYWLYDFLYLAQGQGLVSMRGSVHTCSMTLGIPRWTVSTTPLVLTGPHTYTFLGIGYSPGYSYVLPPATIPDWLPFTLLGTIAAVPWFRWQFSLRALLIATTLVAVVLGLVVWLRLFADASWCSK
jgi:hypothetical protein